MTALDKKLIRDLIHLRGQVIAVALVVMCAIAAFVTLLGAYRSLVNTQAAYYQRYRFADVFSHVKRAPESLVARIREVPGVAAVETRIVVEVTLDVPGLDEPAAGRIISLPGHGAPVMNNLYLRAGRMVEPGRQDEAIVSEAFAAANGLRLGDRIGAVINGRWQRLVVAGIGLSPEYVYEIRGGDIFPDNRRFGVIWMSRDVLGPMFDMEGAFNDVTVTISPGADKDGIIAGIDRLLEPYGSLGAYGREDQLSNRFVSDEISQDRISGIYIPSVFLGVAAFLIHIVLSRLVGTQRDQIAVMKAFGYSDLAIGLHYLKFALVAVFAGTVAGSLLGLWFASELTEIYGRFFRFPLLELAVGPELVGFAVVTSAGAACLGALSAVQRAIKLPPAEAMRPEPPPRFRPGIVEQLGLEHFFSAPAKMIMRNLGRRKGKAVLSTLGIGLAVAILLMSFFFYDVIDRMIQIQFETAQREDMTVMLNEPRPSRVRADVLHLPGVLRSEPFRLVPARLRSGHRSRRVEVLGLTPGGELRRIVGQDLAPVPVPSEGLVLTDKLAELLRLAPGDTVAVEVLEGARPVREVSVAATVDEIIGVAAYMDIGALNRLMHEGGTVSGAFLSVDAREREKLYRLLKRTPAVAGVAVRESMLESFKKTIAESMTASMSILILFACIIAFGMVYNGARIALSERGHELASLRVLGFTKGEIAVILLGEQAVLTALAIPVGFAAGYGISALLVHAVESDLYRMPLVMSGKTFAASFLVVLAAAALSGALVAGRIRHLDLVAVLKTRE